MNPSRGRLIADTLVARLGDLTLANGFTTDAGTNVLPVGQESIDPVKDGVPCSVVYPGPPSTSETNASDGLSSVVLLREFNIEIVESSSDKDGWFIQSEDLVRDILQVVLQPSSDPAKNWRANALGVKTLRLVGFQVERPAEGVDHLQVSVTIAVRYVEHFFIS